MAHSRDAIGSGGFQEKSRKPESAWAEWEAANWRSQVGRAERTGFHSILRDAIFDPYDISGAAKWPTLATCRTGTHSTLGV